MNNITYAVSVDVNNPIIPYNVYVANVLDSNVRYLEITLYQNGDVIALSNEATATASLVTDDVLIDDSVECTISDNIISVPLEDLQRHGNLDVQVTVTEGEKVLAIPFPIQVRVTPNIAEEAQIDDDSLGSYAEVVREIAAARGDYPDLKDRLAAALAAKADAAEVSAAIAAKMDKLGEGSAGMIILSDGSNGVDRSIYSIATSAANGSFNAGVTNKVPTVSAVEQRINGKGFLTAHQDISGKEDKSNKVTSLSESATDTQYPSAKAVYDALKGKADTSGLPDFNLMEYVDDKVSVINDSPVQPIDLVKYTSVAAVKGYLPDKVYEILDSALSGDPSNIPALHVDNTVDQTHNPDGHYILYYIDSDEVRHNIFDISEYFVGKTSETVTKTVTLFDGTAINETLSEANSNLRYVIWGTTGAHLSFEAGKTYHIEITCTEVNLSSSNSVRLMHYPNGSTLTNYQIFAPVVSGNVLTCDYTVPENGNGLLLRLNAKAGAQNVSLKVTTEEETAWGSIGGSQIVSGVVNQNGTITFTNSDGTTFTTTGSSVIGTDSFLPTATVTQTQSGATVTITDKNGTTTANISNGADGQDYVLTSQDKTDIANIVLGELPTTQEVLYGNTSD